MKIEEVNLTKDNLIKIEEIDNTFYKNDITGIDWYLQRYNENHKAVLLFDNDKCVGYCVYVPIKKELYEALVNGVLINDVNINPKMYINESEYNYVVSSVILKEYRGKGYATLMIERLLKNKTGKFVALTISNDGYKLASKFMYFKFKISNEINVFVKEL